MSLLERLRELIKEESNPDDAPSMESPIDMEEENMEENMEEELCADYVECTADESIAPIRLSKEISELKKVLSEITIKYEVQKGQIIQKCQNNYKELRGLLENLRVEYGIPESGHTINIPETSGKLVSFTKE